MLESFRVLGVLRLFQTVEEMLKDLASGDSTAAKGLRLRAVLVEKAEARWEARARGEEVEEYDESEEPVIRVDCAALATWFVSPFPYPPS